MCILLLSVTWVLLRSWGGACTKHLLTKPGPRPPHSASPHRSLHLVALIPCPQCSLTSGSTPPSQAQTVPSFKSPDLKGKSCTVRKSPTMKCPADFGGFAKVEWRALGQYI